MGKEIQSFQFIFTGQQYMAITETPTGGTNCIKLRSRRFITLALVAVAKKRATMCRWGLTTKAVS